MCGFMIWMNQRWDEWAKLRGYRRTPSGFNNTPIGSREHEDFDRWLAEHVGLRCTA